MARPYPKSGQVPPPPPPRELKAVCHVSDRKQQSEFNTTDVFVNVCVVLQLVESHRIRNHSNFLFFLLSLSSNQMHDTLPLISNVQPDA